MSDDPRLSPLTIEEAPAEARPVLEDFLVKRGKVPNLYRTLARRPAIMVAYADLLNKILNQGTVPTALKELAVIKTSLINGCEY